jgi:hypothetical protein
MAPEKVYGQKCGCGHVVSDDVQCSGGGIYGSCGHENCYGVCEWFGSCNEDENCLCSREEE